MNKFFLKIKSPVKIIKIIGKFEPLFLFYSIPQILIKSILPLLYVYFPKVLIGYLTTANILYSKIATTIIIYVLVLLILNILNAILKNKMDLHADLFSKKIKNRIGNISMNLTLQDIENPEIQDTIKLASRASELTNSLVYIQNIVANIISITGLAYLTLRFKFIFIIFIFFTLFIKAFTVYIQFLHNKKMRLLLSENSRYTEYLFNIAYYNNGTMKELRVNDLQEWYLDKNKKYRDDMVKLHYKSFRLSAFFNILTELVLSLQTFVVLYFLAKAFIGNQILLADFTMYFAAITTLTISLSTITIQLSNYNQQILNVADYEKLFVLFQKKDEIVDTNLKIETEKIEIQFHDVSFVYPNSQKLVLNNINILLKNNEKLVIVGLNGAGKTTFIKLLCKFYRPTKGKITLNGIDIWDIPNTTYYEIISAVFQDFANFSFSIKENISMSELGNEELIKEKIEKIGLFEKIYSLPKNIETYLTRIFDKEGIELSGGQAQKLAIARSIYKDPSLLILDEPTANLDPLAESEIYNNFFQITKNKTTIFISHRLAVSTIADNIAVFVNGEIVEYGTHKKLIEEKGIYYEMFEKQSKNYN